MDAIMDIIQAQAEEIRFLQMQNGEIMSYVTELQEEYRKVMLDLKDILPELKEMVRLSRQKEWARQVDVAKAIADAKDRELALTLDREQKAERQHEIETRLYACNICMDELPLEEMYIIDNCHHQTCRNCLKRQIEIAVTDKEVHIHCPIEGCKENIDFAQASQILRLVEPEQSSAVLQQYDEILMEEAMRKDPDYRRCYNIIADGEQKKVCNTYARRVMRVENSELFECEECKLVFCGKCSMPEHVGTCEEFMRQVELAQGDANKAAFAIYKSKMHLHQCAKCNRMIEKNKGCNHMTCRCGYEYCYVCGKEWTRNHSYNCTNTQATLPEFSSEEEDDY